MLGFLTPKLQGTMSHYISARPDGQKTPPSSAYCERLATAYHVLFCNPRMRHGRCGFSKMTALDEELLRILVCPLSHARLVPMGGWLYSTDRETRRKYPIRDGVPVMLAEESKVADLAEFERVMESTARPATAPH